MSPSEPIIWSNIKWSSPYVLSSVSSNSCIICIKTGHTMRTSAFAKVIKQKCFNSKYSLFYSLSSCVLLPHQLLSLHLHQLCRQVPLQKWSSKRVSIKNILHFTIIFLCFLLTFSIPNKVLTHRSKFSTIFSTNDFVWN